MNQFHFNVAHKPVKTEGSILTSRILKTRTKEQKWNKNSLLAQYCAQNSHEFGLDDAQIVSRYWQWSWRLFVTGILAHKGLIFILTPFLKHNFFRWRKLQYLNQNVLINPVLVNGNKHFNSFIFYIVDHWFLQAARLVH